VLAIDADSADIVTAGGPKQRFYQRGSARKDRPVSFDLPDLKTAADTASVMASILKGVAAGNVAPSEAESIGKLVESYAKTLEVRSLEERITALEKKS
jgi:hypothetical protein